MSLGGGMAPAGGPINSVALESLLDTSSAFDDSKVRILESTVRAFYESNTQERQAAHAVLNQLRGHPDGWRLVQTILSKSSEEITQCFALSILNTAIKTRWQVIPKNERNAIPKYLTDLSTAAALNSNCSESFRNQINKTLVDVARRTWPNEWPSFVIDLCETAKTDQKICENNLQILNLLSEDILDFGENEITSRRCTLLKQRLGTEFKLIFDLCLFVLQQYQQAPHGTSPSLIDTTLKCLSYFIRWNDPDYIFQSKVAIFLLDNFWEQMRYRISCVKCFVEIFGRVNLNEYCIESLAEVWVAFLRKSAALPPQSLEYDTKVPSDMRLFWETFYQQFAIAMTILARHHLNRICQSPTPSSQRAFASLGCDAKTLEHDTLSFIVKLTSLPSEETFKICLEFWNSFCESLHIAVQQKPDLLGRNALVEVYQRHLSEVRKTLVNRMAKPPEVHVVYDEESGTIDRDYQQDTDETALYNQMKQTLILLCHLGPNEMETLILGMFQTFSEGMQRDRAQQDWNPTLLNRLCWSIGSLSGALPSDREKTFLVTLLKNLLKFCEIKRGKENKAIIASMIMYVNGQYPRFLKSNENLLQVVVNKTFEFMEDTFPGVQDMATETFFKLATGCKEKLATTMSVANYGTRFLDVLLDRLPTLAAQLSKKVQRLLLYHAFGVIISEVPPTEKPTFMLKLTAPLNAEWQPLWSDIAQTIPSQIAPLKRLSELLQINERIAEAVGAAADSQFLVMFEGMLTIYSVFGNSLSQLAAQGQMAKLQYALPVEMRTTRRAVLRFIETFVRQAGAQNANARRIIVDSVIPPLLAVILSNFKDAPPELKDAEVITLITSLLNCLSAELTPHFRNLFEMVFLPTLNMINKDFDSYSDLRSTLFVFEKTFIDRCFTALLQLGAEATNQVVASIIFGIQDEKPDISALGLESMLNLLKKINESSPDVISAFVQTYFLTIQREIILVMTDTLHTAGFMEQCAVLQELIRWSIDPSKNLTNLGLSRDRIMNELGTLLMTNFSNLNPRQVEIFVFRTFSLAEKSSEEFSQNARDLKIQLREVAGGDELFEEERKEAFEQTTAVLTR